MNEATDKLSFHTKHAYLMHEYMTELTHEHATEHAMVKALRLN